MITVPETCQWSDVTPFNDRQFIQMSLFISVLFHHFFFYKRIKVGMRAALPFLRIYLHGAPSVKQIKGHTYGAMLYGFKQMLKYSISVKFKFMPRRMVRNEAHVTFLAFIRLLFFF